MSAIILKNVDKSWGRFQALTQINFKCEQGQLLVLLGPSGCGKSTTLRLIAGLETPTSGRIEIGGKDVSYLPPVKRNISMVFQNYALFPHLNVAENILFGLKARKVSLPEQKKRLENAAGLLGLSDFLDRKPAQLSGGQRQRVALGRAIVAQVSVCLMDEPLSNLDAKLRQEMRQEIRFLQQRLKMTMIYVTHDQVEAMTIADKIILMKDGHIEQHGTPEALYNRPETAFAGSFIGNPPMNILTPEPVLMEMLSSRLPGGINPESCQIGIRPENIKISEDQGMEARVETVEYLGADTLIACRFGQQNITLTVKGKTGLTAGDPLKLRWEADHIHLFDASNGRRLENMERGNL
ncbi:ABC transporter ATP-binding protein [Desulfospira joergensenii]|uniref:ABC transporter ATP-binding protein n=1 Tax=Desulfospira joergensenii TaxID=53329 RepID=UPI0003B46F44|nr:ABC transporter ATP-binding protein [Desulfospira joergensenii]